MTDSQSTNTPSVKDRIAAKRAHAVLQGVGAPAAVPSPGSSPAPTASGSRADRFSRFRAVDDVVPVDGFADEQSPSPQEPAPAARSVTPPPSAGSGPVTKPPVSRADRFRSGQAGGQPPRQPQNDVRARVPGDEGGSAPSAREDAGTTTGPAEPWADPNRPAGTAYSEEEWAAAEAANPGCIIFEMLKSQERGLLAKPNDAMDVVFSRSLLIHERAHSPYLSHATVRLEHHGEFGVFRYSVVRSQVARDRTPWVDGSKTVSTDPGHDPVASTSGEKATSTARAQRYRG